jgi:hypothetical protein
MAFGLPHNVFAQMDVNHNGMIDLNELRNFVLFQKVDRNRDGRVTLQEFTQTAGKFQLFTLLSSDSFSSTTIRNSYTTRRT